MRSIFILYLPGHAGNFLTRLFSLSPESIPQLPIETLKMLSTYNNPIPDDLDLIKLYQFSEVAKTFDSWQQFHRAWPDVKEKDFFNIVNINSGFKYKCVIYGIHPCEFEYNQAGIYNEDQIFYVELENHDQWVAEQQKKLNFVLRENELSTLNQILLSRVYQTISLTQMLKGDQEFLAEYMRVCTLMNITGIPDQALILYNDWRSVRYPK